MTVENYAILPTIPAPETSAWKLDEMVGIFKPQFAFGTDQVVRYGVSRWLATLTYRALSLEQRHLLAQFVAKVGRHRAFYVNDPSHNLLGLFPAPELIAAPHLAATWTAGANRTVTTDSDGVRQTSGSSGSSSSLNTAALSVTAGATYAAQALWEPGRVSLVTFQLRGGSSSTGNDYGSVTAYTIPGRQVARLAPSGATMYVNIADTLTAENNWGSAAWYVLRGVSCARAMLVDGGTAPTTQTGSSIHVRELPLSTAGLLLPGDMVEVVTPGYSQLLRVTEQLNSNGSGKGSLMFEPQLRGTVSDADIILVRKPRVKMRLSEDPKIDTRSGWYSDVEINCEETF